MSPQQLVETITQAMSCIYKGAKKPPKNQETGGKPFLVITRPLELSQGIDGSFNQNLSCQYCKDTSHKLENCMQLQRKLAHNHMATLGIIAQEQ